MKLVRTDNEARPFEFSRSWAFETMLLTALFALAAFIVTGGAK